jgi:hypothetical protein
MTANQEARLRPSMFRGLHRRISSYDQPRLAVERGVNDQEKVILTAQLGVLESFILMTLGLYLADLPNDPTYQKASALLRGIRRMSSERVAHMGPVAEREALRYADFLAKQIIHNLPALHGKRPRVH